MEGHMKIYDITKTINKALKVWPGDKEYERNESSFELKDMTGHSSWITASLHTGTHVDAHWHYDANGISIEKHDLTNYIGKCQVIDVTHARGKHIEISDLKTKITEERVLFKTSDQMDETIWDDDFKGISVELIYYLNEQGVKLIGLDTPSVDIYNVGTLSSHQALYKCDIYNIEGLVLNDVPEGSYELIALPLKIEGADGSPVRAVLVDYDM